ncbi:NADP-dependent malic enzyme [Fagus crenata]
MAFPLSSSASSFSPCTTTITTQTPQLLLKDEFYIGLRQRRASGKEYYELLDEFMSAFKQNYGEKVLKKLDDFANHNAFELLAKYGTTHLVLNDDIQNDIQGTAAVVLSGVVAALKLVGGTLDKHTFLFLGAGERTTAVALSGVVAALKLVGGTLDKHTFLFLGAWEDFEVVEGDGNKRKRKRLEGQGSGPTKQRIGQGIPPEKEKRGSSAKDIQSELYNSQKTIFTSGMIPVYRVFPDRPHLHIADLEFPGLDSTKFRRDLHRLWSIYGRSVMNNPIPLTQETIWPGYIVRFFEEDAEYTVEVDGWAVIAVNTARVTVLKVAGGLSP